MPAIYIVTLLVLISSDALPSKVHAGSSGSSDSRDSSKSSDSRDDDCGRAKLEAVQNKIKYLNEKKQQFPKCTCGTSGTICKIDIFNANSGKTTTLLTCSGCAGPHVPVTSSKECKNVPDCFRPDLEEFCQIVHPRCKSVTVYKCGCPTVSTTTPLQTTTSVPQPPVTTQGNPTVATGVTAFRQPGYSGLDY